MLYKKYHRNFVKQFKIGARFKFKFVSRTEIVKDGPYYFNTNYNIEVRGSGRVWWELVCPDGKINKYLYVIQKISQKFC